jgi:hypothetical protein
MLLFNRIVKLVVYLDGVKHIIPSGLEISFDVLLRSDRKPNTAEITIYEIDTNIQNLFSEEMQYIEFHAGWGKTPVLIFAGHVRNVIHNNTGTETSTTIFASENLNEFVNAKFDRSFAKGTDIQTIIDAVVKKMGLPNESNVMILTKTTKSWHFTGACSDVLDELARDWDFDWEILNGKVELTLPDTPIMSNPKAVVINDKVTLDSPKIKVNIKNNKKVVRVVTFKSMLIPSIRPKRYVSITAPNTNFELSNPYETVEMKKLQGIYVVDNVRFFGMNTRGDYTAEVEAIYHD